MTEKHQSAQGACLCGAVKVYTDSASGHGHACHCNMCRNWTGGPLLAVDCGSNVEFEGEEHVSVFSSSDWAQRGFCSRCGTHLFYRLKESGQTSVPAGDWQHELSP